MKIDTHQHFWSYNDREYGWMGPDMDPIKRDFLPGELAGLIDEAGIDGTVAVQARQCTEENDFLLRLADENSFIKAVVGWVDLRSPQLEVQLEQYCWHPKFRGVRHVLHDEPDNGFMLREDFVRGIGRLRKYNLAYDLLLFPEHLPPACELAGKFPEQTFVLDHISKPAIKQGKFKPWDREIRKLASFENVSCKISGMVTEADRDSWEPRDFKPYMDIVFEYFGPERVIIGSDWPVCTLAGTYKEVIMIADNYIKSLSQDQQDAIWSENPKRIYGIFI